MSAESQQVAPWPEGVVARHLTWGGEYFKDERLTVDVVDDSGYGRRAVCRGCGDEHSEIPQWRSRMSVWAMDHAAACRALPRPGVA